MKRGTILRGVFMVLFILLLDEVESIEYFERIPNQGLRKDYYDSGHSVGATEECGLKVVASGISKTVKCLIAPVTRLINTIQKRLIGNYPLSSLSSNLVFGDTFPDAELSVPELLIKYGYPAETHQVVTDDGYILTLHRIPYGRSYGPKGNKSRRVILLQHGFLSSSSDWLMNTVDKALGYRLADVGFDVWLANARGNTYSRSHISLSPKDSAFWNFSFDEMGNDLTAVIDYILKETRQKDLYYVGHSMGSTIFWVAMSTHPEYTSKIRAMIALAPVAFLSNNKSPIKKLSPFANDFQKAAMLFGEHEFLPQSPAIHQLQKIFCRDKTLFRLNTNICENLIFLIFGFDMAQLNESMVPVIVGHIPAGSSSKVFTHFLQLMNSGEFSQFDYGSEINLEVYGSLIPPEYNLSQVQVPVALYRGQNDIMVVQQDVKKLSDHLPNVIDNYEVKEFNHLDFLYAINSNELLYNRIIELLMKI